MNPFDATKAEMSAEEWGRMNALRLAIILEADGLPFQVIVSPIATRPEIDPDWDEPDDFDWGNDEPPYTGKRIPCITAGWKAKRRGEFFLVEEGPAEKIIHTLEESYDNAMRQIEEEEE